METSLQKILSQAKIADTLKKSFELEKARRRLVDFTLFTKPDYEVNWHHQRLCDALDKLVSGDIKRLMVFMPPRNGKCLAGDSDVMLADGTVKKIKDITPGTEVKTLDARYNIVNSKVINHVNNGVKPVYEVVLHSGKKIVCTDNHPLLTIHGWKEVKDLKPEDNIGCAKKMPFPEEPEALPYGLAGILGYLVGDGAYSTGIPRITAVDPAIIAELEDTCSFHGWELKTYECEKYAYHIRNPRRGMKNPPIEMIRKYMEAGTSWTKRIPECIFKASPQDTAKFLAAYFNCDGNVGITRNATAEYYSVNEWLLRDTQCLLMRFGIYSDLRKKKGKYKGQVHNSWRLIIAGQDLIKFSEMIPVIGVKGEKLRKLAEETGKRKAHYPEYDAIPPGWKDYLLTGPGHLRKQGIRVDKVYKRGTARQVVKRIAEIEDNEYLRKLCSNDINWERIVEIKPIGQQETFDIEIKDTHNFTVMGVFVHNSELGSRRFPAYVLGKDPDAQIIATSYSADLASRMNRDVQRIIDSPEYQEVFPGIGLNGSNVRTIANGSYLRNSDIFEIVGHKGVYKSSGIGGGITGMGMTYGIIDDPFKNRKEAESKTMRDAVWDWYTSTFYTRLEKDARLLIILTRWHENDLAGRLLQQAEEDPEAEQWTVINYPAIAEDPIDETDPRKEGEPLWPAKYSLEDLIKIKKAVGTYEWSALYQQRPSPSAGNILNRGWWNYYKVMPTDFDELIQSWDCAFKDNDDSDFVVGQVWGRKGADKYLLDQVRDRMDLPATINAVRSLTAKWPRATAKLIEDKANGPAVIQMLKHEVSGMIPVNPQGGKIARAYAASPEVEAGNVYLPDSSIAPWVHDFVNEAAAFPNSTNDDSVDCFTQAIIHWQTPKDFKHVAKPIIGSVKRR